MTPIRRLQGFAVLLLLSAAGCGGGSGSSGGPLRVTVTTGMIADLVKNVGGDRVTVSALMGPGVDPHLYKATQSDLEKLSNAAIIFYNGLHLEGKMTDVFVKMARTRPTVPVSESIPEEDLREPPEFGGNYDPHIWFDVSLWMKAVDVVAAELSKIDAAHAGEYAERGRAYRERLGALHTFCRENITTIPRDRRVLVTAHDAFGYFGRAYDIEVMGLQGISTVAEYGLQDLARLVDVIVERKINAVFVESSVPQRSIEALVKGCEERGHAVRIGGELFSDAMGGEGTPEGTYEGMVRHNVTTIVEALR